MTWPTHTVFGISALWLLAPLPPELVGYDFGTLAAFAAFGALLPDLDASDSKIKHLKLLGTQLTPFFLPSQVIHRSDRHRGILHSLAGLSMAAGVSMPLTLWVGRAPVVALLLGYASHLAGDACTRTDIPLLYPRKGRYFLLPARLRIVTGSDVEEVFFAVFACLSLVLLVSSTSVGL